MLKFGIVIRIFILIVAIVLFGSTALNIIGKIFEIIAKVIYWLGGVVDFFGWGGIF